MLLFFFYVELILLFSVFIDERYAQVARPHNRISLNRQQLVCTFGKQQKICVTKMAVGSLCDATRKASAGRSLCGCARALHAVQR